MRWKWTTEWNWLRDEKSMNENWLSRVISDRSRIDCLSRFLRTSDPVTQYLIVLSPFKDVVLPWCLRLTLATSIRASVSTYYCWYCARNEINTYLLTYLLDRFRSEHWPLPHACQVLWVSCFHSSYHATRLTAQHTIQLRQIFWCDRVYQNAKLVGSIYQWHCLFRWWFIHEVQPFELWWWWWWWITYAFIHPANLL